MYLSRKLLYGTSALKWSSPQLKKNVGTIYLFHTSYSKKETPIFGKLASTVSLKSSPQLEVLIIRTFVTFQNLKP